MAFKFDSEDAGWGPYERLFEAFAGMNVRLVFDGGRAGDEGDSITIDCEILGLGACVEDSKRGVRVRPLDLDGNPHPEGALRFVAFEDITALTVY